MSIFSCLKSTDFSIKEGFLFKNPFGIGFLLLVIFVAALIFAGLATAETKTEFNSSYTFHKAQGKTFLIQSKKLSAIHGDTATATTDTIEYYTFRTTIQTPGFQLTKSTEPGKYVDFNPYVGMGFGFAYTRLKPTGTDTSEYARWAVQIGALITEYSDSSKSKKLNIWPDVGFLFLNNIVGVQFAWNCGNAPGYDFWDIHRGLIGLTANYQITLSK
jgi:hypothetical protein